MSNLVTSIALTASSLLSPQVEPVLVGTHAHIFKYCPKGYHHAQIELIACTYIAHHSHSQVDGHNAAVKLYPES